MARFGKILLYSLGVVFLLVLEVGFPERSDLMHPPRLHADEAVQWSLAKDAAGGVPYSVNEDKFHGPALAVATRGVFAARGLAFDDATVADLRQIPFYFFVLICAVPLCLTGVAWPMRLLAASAALARRGRLLLRGVLHPGNPLGRRLRLGGAALAPVGR